MNDPHDRFTAWLTAGASGEPPRDAAIHASACAGCMRMVAAFDDLLAVDAGAASVPPRGLPHPGRPRSSMASVARVGAGALAVGLVGTAVTIGISSLLPRTNDAPPIGALATETPTGEGVLAGAGGPGETERPGSSPTATATESGATPTDVAASTVPPPPVATPPPVLTPPVVPPPPTAAPQPTAAPTQPPATPVPATPTPIPTAAPTPVPTAVPPPATPTPPPASEEPPAP